MPARPSFAGSTRPQARERPASRTAGATSATSPAPTTDCSFDQGKQPGPGDRVLFRLVQHQLNELINRRPLLGLHLLVQFPESVQGEDAEFVTVPREIRGRLVDDHEAGDAARPEQADELIGHHGAHRPADQHRPLDAQLDQEGLQVHGTAGHRVAVQGLFRPAVATQVRDDHSMARGQPMELPLEEAPAHAPAVDEDNG